MSISHDDVEHIIRLLDASQFDELHLELEGLKLDLRRRDGATTGTRVASSAAAPVAASGVAHGTTKADVSAATPVTAATSGGAAASPASSPADGFVEVKAPMLGTFFRAPKPGAAPFVTVGSRVEPDTVIGIVEVMKLMNSVAAGVAGEVVEVVAPDAQLVEYDQVLIRVRPD